jgi:hypothetical protein
MFEFSHIVSLMLFIIVGGIGMASMQDGLALVVRRLGKTLVPALRGKAGTSVTSHHEDYFLFK